ncbi:helix-turn-helix domain-containing protein [Hydrogenimonas sp.]
MIRTKDHKKELRKAIVDYAKKHGIRAAARQFRTTRNTVRRWLRRSESQGSLEERSRRPHRSPRRTPEETEQLVVDIRKRTNYGPHRIRDILIRQYDIELSEWTIRNILVRHGLVRTKQERRDSCYVAHWAWEQKGCPPFTLVQADLKDVHDKATLGTELTTHLRLHKLPRYQWTFLEAQSRLRFMAYSYEKSLDCGLTFLTMCLSWCRAYGIVTELIQIQTDWGEEFGGDNPAKIHELNEEVFMLFGAELCRYPKGRKGYNGRVERLHRSDDEEFYKPTLKSIKTPRQYLDKAFEWQAYYNLHRPHYGYGMNGMTPMEKLRQLLKQKPTPPPLPNSFALLPPLILDDFSYKEFIEPVGSHVSAKYIPKFMKAILCGRFQTFPNRVSLN